MRYRKIFKENFVNVPDVHSDADILRLSIQSELDASNLYEVLASKTKNTNLKKILLDISEEEKVHVGEFQKLLAMVDNEFNPAMKKASDEVNEKLA